jgi:hypothetical protein
MNTRRARKFELRRRKREFKRSPRMQERYGAFKDMVGQAHDTFQALRRKMDAEGDAPLWATRKRNLRKLKRADGASRKAAKARRLRTIAEARQHGSDVRVQV